MTSEQPKRLLRRALAARRRNLVAASLLHTELVALEGRHADLWRRWSSAN